MMQSKNLRKNKIIILDNGHGKETAGKRSPDGLFREYRWCRDFVKILKKELTDFGYTAIELVPEENDISLDERINRTNDICKMYDVKNCILVSIHNNAAKSDGEWHSATGWEAYTTRDNTDSDKLADLLYKEIELQNIHTRKDYSDGDSDKEANFKILLVNCAAVLTENMFMDNKNDIEFLNSDEGISKLIAAHKNAIKKYFGDIIENAYNATKTTINKQNLK